MQIKPLPLAIGLVTALLMGSLATRASAGVNEKMEEMFRVQSNYTAPGTADGAVRGVVTGGGLRVRNPIVNVQGVNFEAPRITAGCGGIDLYAGNLSFPSKEQYIATARAIVSNIGGYAFKSALNIICEHCESIMTNIQERVNDMNLGALNSCEVASQIIDGNAADAIQNSALNLGQAWRSITAGLSNDSFSAAQDIKRDNLAEEAKDPEISKLIHANWVWSSMTRTGAFDWLGSERRGREEIMSLLGTVVTCIPGQPGCEGDGPGPHVRFYPPKLTLHDFVAPKREQSEVTLYACRDDACLNVNSEVKRTLGANVVQTIEELLLGKEGQPGVLDRMNMPGPQAGSLTSAEKLLIGNMAGLTAKAAACYNAGEVGVADARVLVEGLAPVIAANVLYRSVDQSLTGLTADLGSNTSSAGAAEAVEMLNKTRADLRVQYAEIERVTTNDNLLAHAIERCAANPVTAFVAQSMHN